MKPDREDGWDDDFEEEEFEPQLHSPGMRETSVAAFEQILEEGLLTRMRWLAYECLYNHGPLTGSEVNERIKAEHGGRDNYHKRLSELRRLGVVREVGERKCKVTGRRVILWDVTSNLPLKEDEKEQEQEQEQASWTSEQNHGC